MIFLKKWVKVLLTVISVLLAIIIVGGIVLYFTSAKYKLTHDTAVKVSVYYKGLGKEIYVFTEDEKARVIDAIDNMELGKNAIKEYESVSNGPIFPFKLEYSDGRTVEIYYSGEYLHINSVPFEIDAETAEKLSRLHLEIDEKINPYIPELIQEDINQRLPK